MWIEKTDSTVGHSLGMSNSEASSRSAAASRNQALQCTMAIWPPLTGFHCTSRKNASLNLAYKQTAVQQDPLLPTSAKPLSPRARVLYSSQSVNQSISQTINQSINLRVPWHFKYTQSINQLTIISNELPLRFWNFSGFYRFLHVSWYISGVWLNGMSGGVGGMREQQSTCSR